MTPAAALTAFAMLAVPSAVFVAVWAVVMAYRILFPERPLPFLPNGSAQREAARARGEAVPVGFREIHDDLRRHARHVAVPRRSYAGEEPDAEPWKEDLWRRRN